MLASYSTNTKMGLHNTSSADYIIAGRGEAAIAVPWIYHMSVVFYYTPEYKWLIKRTRDE